MPTPPDNGPAKSATRTTPPPVGETPAAGNSKPLHPSVTGPGRSAEGLIRQALGGNLVSLSLVGPTVFEGLAANDALQTLVVLKSQPLDAAQRLGEVAKSFEKARVGPPWLMTDDTIRRSLDTFPIEYLYMRNIHHAVLGPDPFVGLTFEKQHVRLQCEREAKRYLIQIRQAVMRSRDHSKALRSVLRSELDSLLPLFHAVLFLRDLPLPQGRSEILDQLAGIGESGFDAGPFRAILNDLTGQATLPDDELPAVMRRAYESLERLSLWLDALT